MRFTDLVSLQETAAVKLDEQPMLLRAAGETDSPIPDVLSGDLLRAAAYKQAGLAPQRASRLTVQLLLADGRLLNQKAVVERLTRALSSVRLAGARKA